ncbi:phage tail protein [Sphingomonas tabacisoli]|uniref:Phage tail protein n=1 Tax=Sphingomonas tabacisoli TaxID=2249466 RepID=A0ABW4HZ79_9SPHN
MRVAGTVIWATDLVEHRSKQGGSKGRPSTTTYSYTASFAVLLSARPIRSVGRIWADGNLLRGAGGDWKAETGFRVHLGGEDQDDDPLIASAEGTLGTPAYRGGAYVVFENLALGAFGNRIPSLTFEVEADVESVPVCSMLQELSAGTVIGESGPVLGGLAVSAETMRGLIEELRQALPTDLRAEGGRLHVADVAMEPVALSATELGEDRSEALPGAAALPQTLELGYYDRSRDFQAGVQSARRPDGRRTERVQLAAVLDADVARGLAEAALARLHREQGKQSVRCGWARLGLAPGSTVRLPDSADLWQVASRTVQRDGVSLELRRTQTGSAVSFPSDAGRNMPAADRVHGPTIVHLLDLPSLTPEPANTPRLYIAAAGPSPGWRKAGLMVSLDAGASWEAIGQTAPPAVIGNTTSVLNAAGEALIDEAHRVDVQLLHDQMLLEDADPDRLVAGANLALLGDELIQFGSAEPLGEGRWRLSQIVRARRGTAWAASAHSIGERFVLIDPDTLAIYEPPLSATGTTVRLLASGIGDETPAETAANAIGEALRPPAPVHPTFARRSDGGFDLRWIRSSRAGWEWLDGADAPLAEDQERYRLTIRRADGVERAYELAQASFLYGVSDAIDDATVGASVLVDVVQLGSRSVSRAATLPLIF